MANDPTKLVFDDLPAPSPGSVRLTFGDDSPEPQAHGVRLVFGQPAATSPGVVRLVFGGEDDGPAPSIPDATLHGAGRITGLRLHITVRTGLQLVGSGRITGMRLRIVAAYKINAARPTVARTNAVWQVADHSQTGRQDRAQDTLATPSGAAPHWQLAIPTPAGITGVVNSTLRAPAGAISAYTSAVRALQDARTLYSNARRDVRNLLHHAYANAQRAQTPLLTLRHQDNLRDRRPWLNTGWQEARRQGLPHTSGQGAALWLNKPFDGAYENAMRPPPGMYVRPPVVPKPDPCYLPTLPVRLAFGELADSSLPARLVFVCERHGPPDPQPGTVTVPVKEVYLVINSAVLIRVEGAVPIPTLSMSMSLDVDSWTWSFSASVPGYALPDIEPEDGVPVAVQATINGTPYRFVVESITRERTFGRSDLRIGGRGRAAVLDAPYAPIMSFGNEFGRTAQQIMNDILVDNGVPLGWDVEWNPDDWNVPAGVFNHQGSYISAMNQVAGSIAAYLQPHNTDETLRVLSRYPVAPWDWAGVTPDFELPAAVMSRESIEWRDKPRYNRVYVMGQQAGVNGRVTRAGTAGDYLAPSVVDPLITQAVAARQRGIAVLSDTGRIATVGLRLPVLAETGIIKPGNFVRYTDGGTERIGITRSVQVEVGLPAIWQTLGVETHVEPV